MARCVLDETGLVAKAVATIPSCAVKVSLMLAISAVWVFTVLVESFIRLRNADLTTVPVGALVNYSNVTALTS